MVIVNLPPAVERELKERAAKCGQTLEQHLQGLAVREAAASPAAGPDLAYPPGFSSPEAWVEAFLKWAAGHRPVDHFVDDSRESIYDGRGE